MTFCPSLVVVVWRFRCLVTRFFVIEQEFKAQNNKNQVVLPAGVFADLFRLVLSSPPLGRF